MAECSNSAVLVEGLTPKHSSRRWTNYYAQYWHRDKFLCTAALEGQMLIYNTSAWINSYEQTGGGTNSYNTEPVNGQKFIYTEPVNGQVPIYRLVEGQSPRFRISEWTNSYIQTGGGTKS